MSEYHTVYKGPEGETTQWEDIQTRLGNLPPKPKPWRPDAYRPPEDEAQQKQQRDAGFLDARDERELSDLEDEFADDRALEEYRRKRMAELRAAAAAPRFGSVEEIAGNEFVARVTDASDAAWVVCLLYKPSHTGCALLGECLDELARAYPATSFVRIISTSCIPNYPDANLPTILLYHERACVKSLVGLAQFGGPRATPEQVALALNAFGPVCAAEGEDEAAAAHKQVKGLVQRMLAEREREQRGGGGAAGGDESSDFGDD